MVMQFYFYQQRIAITFVDVFFSNKNSSPEIVEIEREGPRTTIGGCMVGGRGQIDMFTRFPPTIGTPFFFEEGTEPLFAAFYCPERVPTKNLPPYPATNIVICTSPALPMAQPSVLYTYSGIGKQRCVCFAGSGFVWSSIGLIHTLYKMKTYE